MGFKFSKIAPSLGVLALLASGAAHAQEIDDSEDEIVVTGTSIRGIAPAGAETVSLGQEAIEATNAPSTVQLLTSIPQISGFNTLQALPAVGNQQTSNLPAIRGLRSTQSGSSPTLLLVDGRRVAGSGVTQTIADPDVIPPGVIERVEVVTDGGSSVYGADAVGGVINFITRREYDGVEISFNQGFGDEYQSTNIGLLAGKTWDTGSAYVMYDYSQHDAIYGRDRDYVRDIFYDPANPDLLGLGTQRGCGDGSVTTGGNNYAITDGVVGTTPAAFADIQCDLTDDRVIFPQERRDSLFVSFEQELNDWLTFDLRTWYTTRLDKSDLGIGSTNRFQTITASNAYFQPITGAPGETQTVYYNFGSSPGYDSMNRVEMETYALVPQLTADLGNDWQARGFVNYSFTETNSRSPGIDGANLTAFANQINFYDPASTDGAILEQLFHSPRSVNYGTGQTQIVQARVVVDGPVFRLPAGEVRLAAGSEYLGEQFENRQYNLADASDSRRSHAFFTEVHVPVVGPDNNVPLVEELNIDLAARYDTYSDFGSVTTPRVGITYAPLDWLHFRGTYGQSFQAPSLANTAEAGRGKFFSNGPLPTASLAPYLPAGTPFTDFSHYIIAVDGAVPLEAQRAETFSLGTDLNVPFIQGLDLGLTYWHIDYAGIIDTPPFLSAGANGVFFTDPQYSQYREFNNGQSFSQADTLAFLAGRGLTQTQIDTYFANNPQVAGNANVLIDVRRRNLGAQRIAGWDLYARYTHDTDFGSIFGSFDATYMATNKLNAQGSAYSANTADDDILGARGVPRWNATATVGFTLGDDFRAQGTMRYTPSYGATPSASNAQQDEIDAMYPVDLYSEYNGFEDISLSLGVNNVFDQEPPHYNGVNQLTYGYVGGNLGRVVYLGISKHF